MKNITHLQCKDLLLFGVSKCNLHKYVNEQKQETVFCSLLSGWRPKNTCLCFNVGWGGVRQQSVATLFMSRHLILVFLKVEAFKCSIVFNIFRADE